MESIPSKQTILIVDDQPLNVDVLRDILRSEYRVKVALSGEQALNLAMAETPPDLILLDIMMPEMDGYEVCRRLKLNPFVRSIPVIFVTAMSEVVDESRGFELGAVDYITKPISPPLVLARVRTQLALYNQNRSLEEMVRKRTEDLQRANQRLTQERAWFEWVVRTAEDGYIILDHEGCIVFANSQARLYLNLPLDAAPISEEFLHIVKAHYQLQTQEAWAVPLGKAKQPRYLIRPETPTAQPFWLAVDILEMQEVGKEKWRLVRLRDVTEKINTQQNWGTFTQVVSHKLRTPLTIAIGNIELLARHSTDLPAEEVGETAHTALLGMKRLRQTVEDVLAYNDVTRFSSGDKDFQTDQLPLLARGVAADLKLNDFEILYSETLSGCSVMLSQRALELILWELLENSRKFHPKQAPKINLSIQECAPETARLLVSDDGIHLSPQQLGRLWTPYYQAEKHFSGETPGMGLGLAQVAILVWGAGGTCRAYNREDGPGLCVELRLPLQKASNLAAQHPN